MTRRSTIKLSDAVRKTARKLKISEEEAAKRVLKGLQSGKLKAYGTRIDKSQAKQ